MEKGRNGRLVQKSKNCMSLTCSGCCEVEGNWNGKENRNQKQIWETETIFPLEKGKGKKRRYVEKGGGGVMVYRKGSS